MLNVFRRNPRAATIEALYGAIVAQARAPVFYRDYRVPDTVNGRLDLLMLHLVLVFDRLSQPAEDAAALIGQGLFDRFCRDVDDHLREDGVSDLKVPKEVRGVAAAFFGRHGAYLTALKAGDGDALRVALERNVYQGEAGPNAERLARYVVTVADALLAQGRGAIADGFVRWPDPQTV